MWAHRKFPFDDSRHRNSHLRIEITYTTCEERNLVHLKSKKLYKDILPMKGDNSLHFNKSRETHMFFKKLIKTSPFLKRFK